MAMPALKLDEPIGISKVKWFTDCGYVPHQPNQLAVHQDYHRFRTVVAGRRWGKSLMASKEAEVMLLKPDTRGWVVSKTYDLTKKVIREIEIEMVRKHGFRPVKRQMSGPIMLEFPWGSWVEGKSVDNPESLLGEGLDWLIFDECAKCPARAWEEYLRPTLTDRLGWALFITTPAGYNWVYDLWKRGNDPKFPAWSSHQAASWTNPYLSKEDIEEAKNTLPRLIFEQEYGANFTLASGQVYAEFEEPFHVVLEEKLEKMINKHWLRFRSIDFGYENPFVCLWIAVDPVTERIVIYDEYYQKHRTVENHAKFLVNKNGKTDEITNAYIPAFDTPLTKYEWTVCDVSGLSARGSLKQNGIPTVAHKSLLDKGLEEVRKWLNMRYDAEPMIMVSSRCVNLIKEFNLYSYPEGGARIEEPIKDHDHGLDPLRYFIMSIKRWGAIKELQVTY